MLKKQIICDRCGGTVCDSDGSATGIGYAEVNFNLFDGKQTSQMHFCETCWDLAVKVWNSTGNEEETDEH